MNVYEYQYYRLIDINKSYSMLYLSPTAINWFSQVLCNSYGLVLVRHRRGLIKYSVK